MSNENPTIEEIVLKYRQLRDKKDEIKARHVLELKPFNDAMETLEVVVLDHLNKSGAESIRTASGTCYKTRRTSYKVDDPHGLIEYVKATGDFDVLERRASKSELDDRVEKGLALPPGISVSSDVTVNFRK